MTGRHVSMPVLIHKLSKAPVAGREITATHGRSCLISCAWPVSRPAEPRNFRASYSGASKIASLSLSLSFLRCSMELATSTSDFGHPPHDAGGRGGDVGVCGSVPVIVCQLTDGGASPFALGLGGRRYTPNPVTSGLTLGLVNGEIPLFTLPRVEGPRIPSSDNCTRVVTDVSLSYLPTTAPSW